MHFHPSGKNHGNCTACEKSARRKKAIEAKHFSTFNQHLHVRCNSVPTALYLPTNPVLHGCIVQRHLFKSNSKRNIMIVRINLTSETFNCLCKFDKTTARPCCLFFHPIIRDHMLNIQLIQFHKNAQKRIAQKCSNFFTFANKFRAYSLRKMYFVGISFRLGPARRAAHAIH